MTVEYSKIADVVKKAYVYNTLDLHYIPEGVKNTLHSVLSFKKMQFNTRDMNSKIISVIDQIDELLAQDRLKIVSNKLSDDCNVLYVYIMNESVCDDMYDIIYTEMPIDGIKTLIFFLPITLEKKKGLYQYLYRLTKVMTNLLKYDATELKAVYPAAGLYINLTSASVILLSLLNFTGNKEMQDEVIKYLSERCTFCKDDQAEKLLLQIYKETLCFSVDELLDKGYILSIF